MAILCPELKQRFFDANGAPLAGGKLYSYQAGTVVPLATYTDTTEVTPNTNPVILDADGYADVWIAATNYKFVLADSTDVVLWTKDNISGIIAAGSSSLGMGALDGHTPASTGAAIQSNNLYMQSASATQPGLVNTTTQTFAGNKTFSGTVAASNLSGSNTGDQTITLSGDVTGSGTGAITATLATVNANVGSFGDASHVSAVTVNAKGLITAAASTSIQIAESQVTGLVSDLAAKQATGNYITALTGDVTASGPGSAAATIAANAVSNAKAAQMATNTIKGNNTGGTANAADLTVAQVNAILPVFTSTLNGLAPLSGGGTSNFLRADGSWAAPGGSGTVTSVALTTPAWLSVSGSPVTTSGTLAVTATTGQTANQFLATPNGSTGAVALRAIAAADVPTLNQNTSGSAASFTGSLSGDVSGTQSATSVNKINGVSLGGLATGILKNTTSTGVPSIAVAGDFPTLNQNTTGTANNVTGTVAIANGGTGQTAKTAAFDALQPMSTLGDVVYGGASGTGTRLAGNTTSTKNFLVQTGTGSVSAAPAWGTIAAADVPTLNQNTSGTAAGLSTTLAIGSGGTGQTTANAALNALLPSQGSANGKFLTSNGTDSSWATVTAAASTTVKSKTTTYTILSSDGVILCSASGGAFTVTLPTAVGQTSMIKIQKTDTTFNAVTVGTTSSENITDLGSSATTTTLNTIGEEITLASDNAGWQVIERRIPSKWISDNSAITLSAGFGTVTAASYWRMRVGDSLRIRGSFNTGTVAASTGSIGLGNSLAMDSAKMAAVTQQVGDYGGGFSAATNFTSNNAGKIFYDGTDTANVYIAIGASSSGYTKINVSGNMNNSSKVVFDFLVPISGWKS
jgi:hypothetical protein